MRVRYSITDPAQNELDSLPRLPLVIHYGNQSISTVGLIDSGAIVNVLPYRFGVQLGAVWDNQKARIQLSGNMGKTPAHPLFTMSEIGEFPPVKLAFAWSRNEHTAHTWTNELLH